LGGATNATAIGNDARATATLIGGNGGAATLATYVGGNGGTVGSGTATATGVSHAEATVAATGGNGGNGNSGADAGNGISIGLSNAAQGTTIGGTLILSQTAKGGNGGQSSGGIAGKAGNADSNMNFDDTASAQQSSLVTGIVSATGGDGGRGITGSAGANGGTANANLTITSNTSAHASATAKGGDGGDGSTIGNGGAATASAFANGPVAVSDATAHGGGGLNGGSAQAIADSTGDDGTTNAHADSKQTGANLITFVGGTAASEVNGAAISEAHAAIHGAAFAFLTSSQAIAEIMGAPTNLKPVLNSNPAIKAAFGSSATYFAIGELGGGHSSTGSDVQISTSSVEVKVDLTQMATLHDLVIGLYGGTSSGGADVTNVTLSIVVNGNELLHQSFATAAAATAYFTNHGIDLGSLASGGIIGSSTNLDVVASLSVTTDAAGASFDGGILIGDPPAHDALHSYVDAFGNAGLMSSDGGVVALQHDAALVSDWVG
jgi:hypothetical protein